MVQFAGLEYQLFRLAFVILTLAGTWYPSSTSESSKISSFNLARRLYSLGSVSIVIFSIVCLVQVTLNVLLTLGTNNFNLDDLFVTAVVALAIAKRLFFMQNRDKLLDFVEVCAGEDAWHRPRNPGEQEIQDRAYSEIRNIVRFYLAMVIVSVTFKNTWPIFATRPVSILPLNLWYPYKIEDRSRFWATYWHQVTILPICCSIHVGSDMVHIGFLIHLAYQLRIIRMRLVADHEDCVKNLEPSDLEGVMELRVRRSMECIREIYRFADDVDRSYENLMIYQVYANAPSLLINAIYISLSKNVDFHYLTACSVLSTCLCQLFLYCWYGNEIYLESKELAMSMFYSNWIIYNSRTKKLILLGMTIIGKPILMKAGAFISMNIDSFLKILKTTYSMFNVIRQTAD